MFVFSMLQKMNFVLVLIFAVNLTLAFKFFDPQTGGTPGLPGIKIFLSNKVPDYFVKASSQVLNNEIRKFTHLSDFDASIDHPLYKIHGRIHNIQLMSFSNVTSNYFMSSNRFNWQVTGGQTFLRGSWHISVKVPFLRTKLVDGHFFAESLTGPKLTISAKLEKDLEAGKYVTISDVQCAAWLHDLRMCIQGGNTITNAVLHLIEKHITHRVKENLKKEMCHLTKKFVQNVLNMKAEYADFQYRVSETNDKLIIDTNLMKEVQMTEKGMEAWVRGDTINKDFPEERTPFYPHPIAQPSSFDKMLYASVSDFNFNSIAYQVHHYGFGSFDSSQQEISRELQGFLKLKCHRSQICLGSMYPDIADNFPDAEGQLHVHTTSPAQILFTEEGAFAKASAYFELVAVGPTGITRIFGANGTATGDVDFTVADNNEQGSHHIVYHPKVMAGVKIRPEQSVIEGTESELMNGDQIVDFVQIILPFAVEAIEAWVNSTFQVALIGVEWFGMVTYWKDPQIRVRHRTLELSTDFVVYQWNTVPHDK